VHIIDGRVPHAMLLEILTDQAYGTMIRSHWWRQAISRVASTVRAEPVEGRSSTPARRRVGPGPGSAGWPFAARRCPCAAWRATAALRATTETGDAPLPKRPSGFANL